MFGPDRRSERRGQATTVGTVLIIAIVMACAVAIVAFGSATLDDAQGTAETERAVQSLSQFDSQAAKVALGDSTAQTIEVPNHGDVRVNGTSGTISVELVDRPGAPDVAIVDNESLGAVIYQGETQVAYQGGGVWRRGPNGYVRMVSPPEFHYRQRDGTTPTLTFPLVTVSGNGRVSRGLKITQSTAVSQRFPNTTIKNPLDEGNIEVTVESEYAGGWATYFEERTEAGSVDYNGDETVVATLVTPVPERIVDEAIVSEAMNPSIVGSGEVNSYNSTSGAPSTTTGNGTVYVGEDYTGTGSGDIYGDLIVDGTYTGSGSATVTGTVITTDDVELSGNPTIEGDLIVDGAVVFSGSATVEGDVIAAGDIDISGGGARIEGDAITLGSVSEPRKVDGDVRDGTSPDGIDALEQARSLQSPNLQPIDAEVQSRVDSIRNDNDNAAAEDYDEIKSIDGSGGNTCKSGCTLSNGTYYFSELPSGNAKITLDTTDGPIRLGVDGDITFGGNSEVEIVGDNRVDVYYTGDFETGTDWTNENDRGDQLWLHGKSTSTVEVTGNADFYGVIYAPGNEEIRATGSGSIYGGLVGNVTETGGNVDIYYDEVLSDQTPTIDSAVGTPITFLHVSVTGIRVEPMDG